MKKVLLVAVILMFGVSTLVAAPKPPAEETMTLSNLRKMLGDKTKITSYQKYLTIEKLKRKFITGEGKVIDIKRDVSVTGGTRILAHLQLEDVQRTFVLVLRKGAPAANISVGQRVKFKGRIEQPSILDDTPTLTDGTLEIIVSEKLP
jgi:hypothetical protein